MRGCEMWARAAEKALSTMDFSGKCFFSRVTYHRQIREEEPEEPLGCGSQKVSSCLSQGGSF